MGNIDTSVELLVNQREGFGEGQGGALNKGGIVSRREAVTYGAELPHCGLKDPCPKGQSLFLLIIIRRYEHFLDLKFLKVFD